MRSVITLIVLLCNLGIMVAQAPNRLNKKGERTGRWVTYMDDEEKIKSFEGKFRNGKAVGKAYFYDNEGILGRREINRFKKLKTIFYYPNGVVRMRGCARLENLTDKIHYYFYGKWKNYDTSGVLIKYCFYKQGELIKTIYKDKHNKTNDSLFEVLRLIDTEFAADNRRLTDSINANLKNTTRYNYFKRALTVHDSITFMRIGSIMDRYGYPSTQIAGEASGIPFYILGFAPVSLKEKYLPQLKMAADRGDINWKSLAFFIDKIKVAKNEKQIYGTQGTYDKDYKFKLYPCEDPENLNKRRAGVGLEPESE